MQFYRIKPARSILGEIFLPGDKSIAHRSIIISAIAEGKTNIYNYPANEDCIITLRAFKRLGVRISKRRSSDSNLTLCVEGSGLNSLKKSRFSISVGESGTTLRLLLGVLAGQRFYTTLIADESLARRPMRRITEPLGRMGAIIKARKERGFSTALKYAVEEYSPITIKGGNLRRITYKMPVASAQVKSALLLAGLYAKGVTKIIEPIKTRDHTERMLKYFGVDIKIKDKTIYLRGQKRLVSPGIIYVPGDISSASFFIVAATLLPHSHLVIKSVGINPTRIGLVRVLRQMGANIKVISTGSFGNEPVGDIIVKSSGLRGIEIKNSQVPQLIDELPVLMLASYFARGKTVIYGIKELRVKETDRINSMLSNLRKMGAEIYVSDYRSRSSGVDEKITIQGAGHLEGRKVNCFNDHRTAMSLVIAGLVCKGDTLIDNVECIKKSFPDFLDALARVVK